MLPWAPGTVAGGSCGERAEGQRALIAPEQPQGQPQTPPSCSHTSWRGLPRPHSHGDSPPCPLVPCPPAVMQLGGNNSPTASFTPPLLIRVFAHCMERAVGLPQFWEMQDHNHQPPRSQDTCPSQCSRHCPARPHSRFCRFLSLLTSTCSLQLLPLPTLTVRANLQQKCHMKPPRSCRSYAWPLTTQRERDRPGAPLSAMLVLPIPQGSTDLIQHSAGSKTVLPAPAWPQGIQGSPCGFTQLPK